MQKAPEPVAPQVSAPPALANANPAIQRMLASARMQMNPDHKFVLCGVAGPPKSGKSGGVLDSRTKEEIKAGAEIAHLDFDMGGLSTVAAHHADKPGILVLQKQGIHMISLLLSPRPLIFSKVCWLK